MYIRPDLTHLTDSDELTLRHVFVADIGDDIDRVYNAIKTFIDNTNQNIIYTNGCISIDISSAVEVIGVNIIPHTGFIFAFWLHEEKATGAVKTALSLAKLSPIKVSIKFGDTVTIESIQFSDEGVKR
jgi:hypothetical protein